MRKIFYHYCLAVFFTCIVSMTGIGQIPDYAASKEKIYIQTSHVFFKQGETVFFKLYVVKGKDQTPSKVSNTVYVELINPAGNVMQKFNYRVENGYAEGAYDFNESAVGGIYKIRAYTTWMRNENEINFFTKEVTLQKVIAPRVLMKLDFPEKGYGAGSEVSADFSMRNLNDQPIKFFPCKFTVSVGGQTIMTDDLKTDHEGKAKVKFRLPNDLKTNDGLLNITINYDSYTEAISRSIPIVLNKIDLQFMPEGGILVDGITTNIAFKALNENGKAADIKGEVWDSKGRKITTFESYHFGMGKFSFTPEKNETYKVKIISPANISQQFTLPPSSETGVVMNFSKAEDKVKIKLSSSSEMLVRLIGQTKGAGYYVKDISLKKGNNYAEIDENIFPVGIAQFTLYRLNGLPIAERLVFLNEDKNLKVSITTDKKMYLPREKVELSIKTVDANNKPIPSNFSLAVVDDKLWSFADDKQDHILSWLLMSSELQGKIEEPQFYFKRDEAKAIPALDLLMLTHGYRYFDYTEYVLKEGQLKFEPDQDNVLGGVIVDVKGKPVMANVYLAKATPGGKGLQIKTEDDGSFFFSHLEPGSNYYVFAQSLDKGKQVSIKILQNGTGYNPLKGSSLKQSISKRENDMFFKFSLPGQLVMKPEEKKAIMMGDIKEGVLLGQTNASLSEVVVTGYGIQKRKDVTGSVAYYNAKELNGMPNLGFALQGKVAGLQIVNNANPGADPMVRIRGYRSLAGFDQPLFVINGIPVEQANLAALNPNDIESITILKDAQAVAMYGARGAQGVIVIESKKFRNEKIRFKFDNSFSYASQLLTISGPSYTIARKFYAPKYKSTSTEERTDFRETIYWNAVVQTDKSGEATVEFYNSDASTTFRVIAEGIGWNGKPGRAETTYAVQSALTVDAKIPPYLTVGDKALIPLVVKNNRADDLKISIGIDAPHGFEAGNYSKDITLAPGVSQQILVPLTAKKGTSGNINFIITSEFGTEKISLPITAADKGFPVIATFSGNSTTQHDFMISKMIPGTLKANLKLFKSLEGQLLDGIESMLREPYGCFEQTSSCTYPNIYVLKYLKESGKSNPEIEKQALGYIQRGYQRLMGFETKQNGFEWFGNTPPHEALTAYGLLEFTDMKEFIKVDEQMMKRTKEFLMDRRDGKGSFKMSTGGYDRFASVPNKIANIYIVYALTQAGIGNQIQLEYQTAVKKALESNDGYQMAMMALAASSMKNEKDYRELMNSLSNLLQTNNLLSETSVVNSRDASLRVETVSLYALALMREAKPNVSAIADLISKILAEKSYYGYGSTQSTVLALKAIVEYSKLTGKVSENATIDFIVNNKAIKGNNDVEENLKEGSNKFAVNYAKKNYNIPYNLEVLYSTFTLPNSDKAELQMKTNLANKQVSVGETVRMEIEAKNIKDHLQPMAIAKIGIPAGLSVQPWQLKEIIEKNQVAYYEIFDNYLVFYWMGFAPNEAKNINLDLKVEIPGTYKGKASNIYLYYTPEYKNWNDGIEVEIK